MVVNKTLTQMRTSLIIAGVGLERFLTSVPEMNLFVTKLHPFRDLTQMAFCTTI